MHDPLNTVPPLPTTPQPEQPKPALSNRMRFTLFVHGIILPLNLFGMSLAGFNPQVDQPWQSGELVDYICMLLHPASWFPFAPAVLLAMVSLGTWTIAPATGRHWLVRLGMYTGVILTVQYCALLLVPLNFPMLIALTIVWGCWHGLLWSILYFWPKSIGIRHIMILTMMVAVIVFAFTQIEFRNLMMPPMFVYLAVTLASPGLSVVAYVTAVQTIRRQSIQKTRSRSVQIGIAWLTWSLAWLVSWRLAIITMLDEYSKLSTTNPNCYLSSAAAYGHPWLTRAKQRGDITACMRRLKFLEIVFKLTLPNVHQACRSWYDAYCPPLARHCQSRWALASATCICLLPLELLAECFRVGLRLDRKQIQAIYGDSKCA